MRSLLRSMQPDNFEDISAVLALYRPGPMGANAHNDYADRKNGRKPVVPIHPELAEPLGEILDDTYGLIVYQEQVMAIAQKLAGYIARPGRPAAPRDGQEEEGDPRQGVRAVRGRHARRTATAKRRVKTLWDILVPFSDYAFNKAHTAGYGLVSYWTAYLKANYPAEYMAALLTRVKDDKDKSALLPARVPADGHQGAAAGRQRLRLRLHAARHRHPVRPVGDPQRRRERRRARSSRPARSKGRFADFADFLARSSRSPATRRSSSR